ncbi:MAG: DNA-processing protein DprA [Planctomycetota bacterium]|jgi:DNA processing protein
MARDPNDVPSATLRLLTASGVGPRLAARLRTALGSDEAVVAAAAPALARAGGLTERAAATLRRSLDDADPEVERRRMARAGARLVLAGDAEYPPLLATTDDAPLALWIRGRLAPEDRLAVAIVGSRRCSAYGREQAGRFAALLGQAGLTIVSGGARGIDGEAHRGALRAGGRTIAVVGCGLGECYPPEHARLFDAIVDGGGAVLSELPTDMPPLPAHFPRRNRIIAGMSLGVLVVEAGRASGALITARLAADLGREVMVLPGRVDTATAAGCLQALREGWAAPVCDHRDVLDQLESSAGLVLAAAAPPGDPAAPPVADRSDLNLSDDQQAIVRAIRGAAGAVGTERIAAETGLPPATIHAETTLLEIRGVVTRRRDGGLALRSGRSPQGTVPSTRDAGRRKRDSP